MNKQHKILGVIIGVDGDIAQVGMFSMSNDPKYLWYGDVISGPKVGALLTIHQNEVKIIASVSSEKIFDNQNTVKSREFDNRYRKDSMNRTIHLKTKGIISEDKFSVTSEYVPMIGNEVALTTQEELNIIYNIEDNNESIIIGKSLLESQPIRVSIDRFFASHIGVFGNTGSGKSNTVHKLYLELFRTKFYDAISQKSSFYVIDFNGEYTGKNMFSVNDEHKTIFQLNTRSKKSDKIPVLKSYIFDADILSILFDARPATQVPFLRKAITIWDEKQFDGQSIARFVIGTIKKIITTGNAASSDAKDNWIKVAQEYVNTADVFDELNSLQYNTYTQAYSYSNGCGEIQYINNGSQVSLDDTIHLRLDAITNELGKQFDNLDEIEKLKFHLQFQRVHQSSWKSTNVEHINPLFNRIETAFASLSKVVKIVDDISDELTMLNIISLTKSNQEIKRLIPMLMSKMIYDMQKHKVSDKGLETTMHLIIDEAHNILNAEYRNVGDDWQDYRLSVFEEIIKEGRKFGFYMTLSSQRPADISPTILSQAHNYFIHRLVNEKDLRMLENTMPTLDKESYMIIPKLGQGECVITGTSLNIPIMAKIDHEKHIRPNSDDVVLTDLWSEENVEKFSNSFVFIT